MSSTASVETPEVEIDKINTVEDFNSRTDFNEIELGELATSIELDGVAQPISVSLREDGTYDLVAGERRLRAARMAGLKKIPITIVGTSPRTVAFHENNHRSQLNHMEVARDISAFAQEHGLSGPKAIAERAGKATSWVSQHLKLLDLPEGVHPFIASGEVPITAEPKLRKVAAVSPKAAVLVCEVGRRKGIVGQDFDKRFGEILAMAPESKNKGAAWIVGVPFYISSVISDRKARRELTARINALRPDWGESVDPRIELTDASIDAARAHGCLIEHQKRQGRYESSAFYLTDQEFAADLVERAVDRFEKDAEEAAKAEAERKEAEKDQRKKASEERKESGEESPQAKAKKRRSIGRVFNDKLKHALLNHRTPKNRKKYALARSKAIAAQLISDNPDLAGRGLRYVSDHLQEVTVTTLKSGQPREKVEYASREDCTEELVRRVNAAGDAFEVIEVLSEALLAGILADRDEEPSASRIRWYSAAQEEIEGLLKDEIKEVKPRRMKKPY